MHYSYQSGGSLREAGLILAVAVGLGVVLPDAGLRLLALIFAIPPLAWAGYELARRRRGLTLEDNVLVLRRPISLRALHVPYAQVGGVIAWPRPPRLGLAYYIPRPPFEDGDDPRPPRLRVTYTDPLANFPAARDDLRRRVEQARMAQVSNPLIRPLDDEELAQRLHVYRVRRWGLRVVVFLATPLFVILVVRIVFTLLSVLRWLLPNGSASL